MQRKIGKSMVNFYVDTGSWCYQTVCFGVPQYLKHQTNIDGTYRQYFLQDTGKVAAELEYKGGVLVSYKTFWLNDSLQSECKLVNGSVEGDWISYYPSGVISSRYSCRRGVHYEFWFYFENGQVQRHSKYLESRKDKPLREVEDYYSNGQVMQKGQTLGGYKTGTWTYCNRDGSMCETKKHKKLKDWLGPVDWSE